MTKKLFQVELADALQRIGIGIAFLFAFGLSAAEATSDISVSYNFYEDWGSGACAEAWVTNHDSFRVDWEANLDLGYPISHHWNSERLDSNEPTGGIDDHTSRFMGAYWNRSLEAGTSTSFGFCIDRTEGPTHNPWDNPAMPMTNLDLHDHADHLPGDSDFIDLATYGLSHGSDHTGPDGLVGGRTAITTEALLAYNRLRAFVGLEAATLDEIGAWAFANNLTNNTQAWGNDQVGVGLWYAMQGAKVGWMADDRFDPQGVADITRTARLGSTEEVLTMVFEYGHEGFADFLIEHGFEEAFINTLKMEPHYAGWMHDRTHGWLSIEGVAIAHDVNHLTVLSHDQMQPFMNDTWDWPQWPALDVSDSGVIEYFQSMVSLGDPVGFNLETAPSPISPPVTDTSTDPAMPPIDDHDGHEDHGGQGPITGLTLQPVANTTDVYLLVDPDTGLAYIQDEDQNPILITRNDSYWAGDVPLTRGDASMMAAARDGFGRLRILDGGGVDVYAWILDESGFFIGQDSPSDTSIAEKEALFQLDIDGNGVIGQAGAPPAPADPTIPPVEDHGGQGPIEGVTLQLVADTTEVYVLVDPDTGLAYIQDEGQAPILITRDDSYWVGDVPLTRGDATMMAAARDDFGRLRILDGGGLDVYAWILDENGFFIGEDSPSDTSIAQKEALFQLDIDRDGAIGQAGAPPSPADPTTPPMEDHEGHEDPADPEGGSHDHMAPPVSSGDYTDITSWGTFHGSNHNSEHNELVGGRTAITTEAYQAYNNLRAFLGLPEVSMEEVGEWAFSQALTNNSQAWGNDLIGVGLWYAMQGAKVGWITDEAYEPQILADIQRTARLVSDPNEMKSQVMAMVRQYGHPGYADYLEQYGIEDIFINTMKMEPHYGGWMHGRTHGFRSIEGVAINHDVNHLTVLSWDQMQPFMNDTFDWPQWPALDVSDSGVIEYFQSMVSLGDPVGFNLE